MDSPQPNKPTLCGRYLMTSFSFMVFLSFLLAVLLSLVVYMVCALLYLCSFAPFLTSLHVHSILSFFVCIAYFFPWLVYRPIIRRPTFFVLALLAGPFFLCMRNKLMYVKWKKN